MTTLNNKNYTDGERLLDFITNPANYYKTAYCWRHEGNHSWDHEFQIADFQIKAMIEMARKKEKFMWWSNKSMDFHFYDSVEVECLGLYEDFEIRIEDAEAWDKAGCERVDGNAAIIRLDWEEVEAFLEQLGWDDDRVDAAHKELDKLFYYENHK